MFCSNEGSFRKIVSLGTGSFIHLTHNKKHILARKNSTCYFYKVDNLRLDLSIDEEKWKTCNTYEIYIRDQFIIHPTSKNIEIFETKSLKKLISIDQGIKYYNNPYPPTIARYKNAYLALIFLSSKNSLPNSLCIMAMMPLAFGSLFKR